MTTRNASDATQTVIMPTGLVDLPAKPDRQCPNAVIVQGTGLGLTDETTALLRRRLQVSCWILAIGLGTFLIYRLIYLHEISSAVQWVALIGHVAVTAFIALTGVRLAQRCPYFHGNIRLTELLVFGSCGLFFLLVSYDAVQRSAAQGHIASISPMWMTLIYTYALFIPNTWQRAAVVMGCMSFSALAMLILVVNFSAEARELHAVGSYLQQSIVDHSLVLIISTGIGVWGVYTINTLRREAYEARRLGQYQLRQQLGAGGMGEVYLAEHLMLKRPCAIKLIRPDRAGDAGALARFEREVQATARLTHWNSVEIYDYGHAADGTFYYVMEYLPGMNLDELVKMHGPLPAERIVHLLVQVCDALREAHQQGLIHRDIKPANIFAAQRGGVYDVAKLLDFGLAKPIAAASDLQLTQDGSVTGSPYYMSPEQALGDEADERSDIYSLGAVAWYLATGQPPFNGSNMMKILMAHANEQPARPSSLVASIPAELDDVILKCLAKKPADRPASVDELRGLLEAVPARTEWTTERASQWWTCHGCPQKRKLDELVRAGAA